MQVFIAPTYQAIGASRLTAFNGQAYGYGDTGPYHAVDRIAGADRFDYDANGNMVVRNKGLTSQQTLVWDDENRLSQVQVRPLLIPSAGHLATGE